MIKQFFLRLVGVLLLSIGLLSPQLVSDNGVFSNPLEKNLLQKKLLFLAHCNYRSALNNQYQFWANKYDARAVAFNGIKHILSANLDVFYNLKIKERGSAYDLGKTLCNLAVLKRLLPKSIGGESC